MTEFPVGEEPSKGLRVWTQSGFKSHGLHKIDVLPNVGGTIVFEDSDRSTFGVEWDSGQVTVHSVCDFAGVLICTGRHRTLEEYLTHGLSDSSEN